MALIGVDVGGSKTLSVVVDDEGRCLGVGVGSGGNFQTVGIDAARRQIEGSIDDALQKANLSLEQVDFVYLGVAGADRPADFRIVRTMLQPVLQSIRWDFENDASIGLWAGTAAGVGVAVVCGTGTNVIAFNDKGERAQVGGMGPLFGDAAGGEYIGQLAVGRAMRGYEGRGAPTALYDALCNYYEIDHLLDLVDWSYRGEPLHLARLAPLVFDVAAAGDRVAQQILIDTGRELAISVNAALRRLFADGAQRPGGVPVVGIGSIFQQPTYPLLYDTFVAAVREEHPFVVPSVLDCEPVLGAVYAAARQAGVIVSERFQANVKRSFPGRPNQ